MTAPAAWRSGKGKTNDTAKRRARVRAWGGGGAGHSGAPERFRGDSGTVLYRECCVFVNTHRTL